MWSAWTIPVAAKLVELLKLPSPVRWNVLFVEPCSPGQVPVASVDQPTPVFGGKPCNSPFLPTTPSWISAFMVGIAPCSAYLSTRSGRIPSEANMITGAFLILALPVVARRRRGTGDRSPTSNVSAMTASAAKTPRREPSFRVILVSPQVGLGVATLTRCARNVNSGGNPDTGRQQLQLQARDPRRRDTIRPIPAHVRDERAADQGEATTKEKGMRRPTMRARRGRCALAAGVGPSPPPGPGGAAGAGEGKPPKRVSVQLLAFNDFHGNLEPPSGSSGRIGTVNAGGVEYFATHLKQLEATNPINTGTSPPAT